MTSRLTLNIEKELLADATRYAEETGSSLSDIIEGYLKALTSAGQKHKNFSPRVAKLKGIIPVADDFDYKKVLAEELAKKNLGI